MQTSKKQLALSLEREIHSLFPNEHLWDLWVGHMETDDLLTCIEFIVKAIPQLSQHDLRQASRLYFLCHATHATINLDNYDFASAAAKQLSNLSWNDIPSAALHICKDKQFVCTLYLNTAESYTNVGGTKVQVFSVTNSLNDHTLYVIPQLWPFVYLDVPTCFHGDLENTSQFTIHWPKLFCRKKAKVMSFNHSRAEALDTLFKTENFYENFVKVISLYLYHVNRRDSALALVAASTSTSELDSSEKVSSTPPVCFKFAKTPHLHKSGTHRSPCEHMRKAHVRHLANGKTTVVSSCVVNAGKTAYFSDV